MTYVTQPFMPPLAEFMPYLEAIWRNRWLTNAGPFHEELEAELADYLDVPHVALVANGTIALILALRALDLAGEVITTPFSFVATSQAIEWNNLVPVFADIDPATCNLDPDAIEAAITPRTAAILPVHCFGRPCDVDRIQEIADRHGLPVIYDAAHGFGVRTRGTGLLRYGDMSTLSFHATKVFNTFEGGAITCTTAAARQRLASLRNFGFTGHTTVSTTGMNGKMSEVQAAFGLLQLRHINEAIARRGEVSAFYRRALGDVRGITMLAPPEDVELNHSYFPVLVDDDYPMSRDALHARLEARGIGTRRYFYPLICDMPAYRDMPAAQAALPHARRIGDQVLCLPIFPDISEVSLAITVDTIRACAAARG